MNLRGEIAMTPFETTSMKAAADFLQTVVVVDNMAEFNRRDPEVAEDLQAPDPFAAAEAVGPADPVVAGQGVERSLDAGVLSSSFAAKGLVCAVIRPLKADKLTAAVVKSAERSDILVLDWQMFDDGDAAIEIIKQLAIHDDSAGGKLRLIAIYTSESPLASVAVKIAAKYPSLTQDTRPLTFCRENTRIILLAKEASPNAADEQGFAVTESELPDRLVYEFAMFTQGLLPNATMAAIAGIRDHTHRILARFDGALDGPMLTHRTLLSRSEDAEEFVNDLIMAEIEAQVPIASAIAKYASKGPIDEYISHRMSKGLSPRIMKDKDGNSLEVMTADQLSALVEQGHSGLPDQLKNAIGKKKLYERLYLLFSDTLDSGKNNHSLFAVRAKLKRDASSVRPENEASWPRLRLGSIVRRKDKFWICLTPLCDCTRIPEDGGSFLLAELSENDQGAFDLMLPVDDGYKALELARKRTPMLSQSFKPDASGDVVATFVRGRPKFLPLGPNGQSNRSAGFEWIGELKPMQAQRFTQQYADNLSRIGLDDFEWHRPQFPTGNAN